MTTEFQDDFVVTGQSSPVLCKQVQPWKLPNITHEDLIKDLMGCILSHWKNYRDKFNAPYTQQDAISDAYINGILKAIEKDKKAPTCAGDIIKCEHCNVEYKAPDEMPGDETANRIFDKAPANRLPSCRKITTTCTSCGKTNIKKIEKTIFSTLVFYYIRAAIQKGVREAVSKKNTISIENSDDQQGLIETLAIEPQEEKTILPTEIINLLSEAMDELPEKQRYVLAMRYGIGGIYTNTVEKEISCPHCIRQYENMDKKSRLAKEKPQKFIAIVDYSMSRNIVMCPACGLDIEIDMSMNQTDIAKHLEISKQRICSTLKSITNKIKGNLNELDPNYSKWKKISNKLTRLMYDHNLTESPA